MTPGRAGAAVILAATLAGCGGGGMKLWPFGEPSAKEVSRKPANAAEYHCESAKVFYVRDLEAGAVWLIAPDREIRLQRPAGATGTVYESGKVRLEIRGQEATLLDPPAQFAGCKRAGAKP
jgi:membrane-bound inhibitor of C-type lysozyme